MVTTRPLPSLLSILRLPRTLGLGHRSVHVVSTVVGKLWPPFLAITRVGTKTKLNAGLAIRQRTDLFEVNISGNKISLPQG